MRARYSADARNDLRAIVEFTRGEWGVEQAKRYRRSLQATCDRLASFPEMAPASPMLDDVHVFPAERHRVLYRPEIRGILVLRIIHQTVSLDSIRLE